MKVNNVSYKHIPHVGAAILNFKNVTTESFIATLETAE